MIPGLTGTIPGITPSKGVYVMYSNFSGGNSWTSVPLGQYALNRRIYIAIIHGFVSNDPVTPTSCTVAGSGATRLGSNTTGGPSTPAVNATGEAWFVSNTTATSATISCNWASMANLGIIVFAVYGYTTFQGYEGDGGTTGGSDGQVGGSLNTVNGGAILAVSTYSSIQTPTWTQLQHSTNWTLGWTGSTGNSGGYAWLTNITASSVWNVSPHPTGDGNYMSGWISLAP